MLGAILGFLNLGGGEIALIMFVALLLFGGDKLPGLARGLGKGIRDFKDASEGVKREINNQINSYEDKKEAEKPAELPAHEDVVADESNPLIDTTPVVGTTPIGGTPVTYNNDGVPMHYDENGYLVEMETETEETQETVPAEAEQGKTINLNKNI